MTPTELLEQLQATRVVVVVRARRVPDVTALVEVLVDVGLPVVEFTFTISSVVAAVREASGVAGATVGAGTVLTAGQARAAIEAGATFLVSPTSLVEVLQVSRDLGRPYIAGAFTPTEVQTTVGAGATAVKVYPALGPGHLRQLTTVLPNVPMMSSGGVAPTNARGYLEAGAVALFAGSSVAPADAVETGDLDQIRQLASNLARAIATPTWRSE